MTHEVDAIFGGATPRVHVFLPSQEELGSDMCVKLGDSRADIFIMVVMPCTNVITG